MSQENRQDDISKKKVVYKMAGADTVTVRRDLPYRAADGGALTMDIYYPLDSESGSRRPAVVFVAGYPDSGFQTMLGCKFKELGSSVSWAQLTAASGLVGITYTNQRPVADLQALFQHIRQNSAALGIDANRIGLLASSGNVPLTLSILMGDDRAHLKCAVLCYGFMLDLEGSTAVAEASKMWKFANPGAGKSVDDLPKDVPLFIVRAGRDSTPHLNEAMDRFLVKALERNLPILFANHASAPHAFDLLQDSPASGWIIRQILAFMQFHLLA
jgi:hypothetical protein